MRIRVARYIERLSKVLACSLQPEKLALLPDKTVFLGDIAMATNKKHLFAGYQFDKSNAKPDHFAKDDWIPYLHIRRNNEF